MVFIWTVITQLLQRVKITKTTAKKNPAVAGLYIAMVSGNPEI